MATLKRWNGTAWRPVGEDTYAPGWEPPVEPNTGVDLTSAIKSAWTAAGNRPLFIRKPGVYLVDSLVLDSPGALVVGAGVTLRLKPGAVGVSGTCSVITITSSNVTVRVEGVIDGNRSGQDISAFNAAGGTNSKVMCGIRAIGTSGSWLTNVNVFAQEITETVDFGLRANFVRNSNFEVVNLHDAGCGVVITDAENVTVPLLGMVNLDNKGARVFPHAFDLFRAKNCRFGIVSSTNHMGDDTIAATATLSDWISGATLTNVDDCSFDQVVMTSSADPTQNKGVGVSLLDCVNLRVGILETSGYADLLLELAGVTDSYFGNIDIDGRYQVCNATSYGSTGMGLGNYGYYVGNASRSQRFTERNVFGSVSIRRCRGDGLDVRAGRSNEFLGGRVYGCRRGLRSRWLALDTESNFTPQIIRDLDNNRFSNFDFSYNEEHGGEYRDGANVSFVNCRFNNNGQATSHPSGTTRNGSVPQSNLSGLYFGTTSYAGTLSKTGVRVTLPEASDTQNFTDAASGVSGKTFSVRDPNRYCPGQTIRLMGAGAAGADLVTRIDDMSQDEITIEDEVATRPTIAGTGTISTSGTAVTGVGTAFTTELNARYWITVGGVSRQVIKMADDTHATLSQAFPSNLSGQAFTIVKIAVQGVPSQKFGIYYSADTIAPQQIGGLGTGNLTQFVNDVTVAGQSTRLRLTGVPGQTTIWSNSWTTDGRLAAFYTVAASKTVLGDVGPAAQGGVGAGGTAGSLTVNDVALYRRAAGVWRSENVVELGNQSSPPTAPTAASVLYVEGGVLKVKHPDGTATPFDLNALATHVDAGRGDQLTVGESTLDRRAILSTGAAVTSGRLHLTYFTAKKTETITTTRTIVGSTLATGNTLSRIGIYEEDAATGALTLVGATDNDTALWTTSGQRTKTLASSFIKTRGRRYAVGLLCVGAAPTFHGSAGGVAGEFALSPRLNGYVDGLSDLPSSVAAGGVSNTTNQYYAAIA